MWRAHCRLFAATWRSSHRLFCLDDLPSQHVILIIFIVMYALSRLGLRSIGSGENPSGWGASLKVHSRPFSPSSPVPTTSHTWYLIFSIQWPRYWGSSSPLSVLLR
jgi:hypothetical protein